MSQDKREHRLDALRGLSALCVAIGHCVTARSPVPQYNKTFHDLNYADSVAIMLRLLHIVFNAEAAVIVFFVLSGYVLSKSLSRREGDLLSGFVYYAVKRIYRIIPTVIVSFIPLVYFIEKPAWEYVMNMLLLKFSINGVTWTLQIEMLGSILVFLVIFVATKIRHLRLPLCGIFLLMFFLDYYPTYFMHFPAFLLGCYAKKIQEILPKQKYLVLFSAFFLITADFYWLYGSRPVVALETLSAVILIASISNDIFWILDLKIFRWLGKISFSFYLYHFLAVLVTLNILEWVGIGLGAMHPVIAVAIYAGISVPIAVVFAFVSYYLVEAPSILVGDNLIGIIKQDVCRPICIG